MRASAAPRGHRPARDHRRRWRRCRCQPGTGTRTFRMSPTISRMSEYRARLWDTPLPHLNGRRQTMPPVIAAICCRSRHTECAGDRGCGRNPARRTRPVLPGRVAVLALSCRAQQGCASSRCRRVPLPTGRCSGGSWGRSGSNLAGGTGGMECTWHPPCSGSQMLYATPAPRNGGQLTLGKLPE